MLAAISPLPFVVAIVVALGLFAWCTYLLVQDEARHPVRWRPPRAPVPPSPVPPSRRISHSRIVAISVVFAVWSVWATARPVSGWR